MVCSIYKITNNINEKAYIGQTWKSLNTRISQHKSPNNKGCRKLYNALNKYGRDNFKIELITSCDNKMTAIGFRGTPWRRLETTIGFKRNAWR